MDEIEKLINERDHGSQRDCFVSSWLAAKSFEESQRNSVVAVESMADAVDSGKISPAIFAPLRFGCTSHDESSVEFGVETVRILYRFCTSSP
jgi:hypothetical protein